MEKERIEELMMRPSLTREERSEIRAAAEAAGIAVNVRQGCKTCYEKLLTALYESKNPKAAVSVDGYMLRDVNDAFRVFGSSVVFSNATIGAMEVGGLHPAILSTHFIKTEAAKPETATEEPETEGKEGLEDVL